MLPELQFLVPVFFVIAFTYALAGFGGGSSYLAVLAIAALPTAELRVTALACNLVVAGGGVFHFVRAGVMPWRRALPLVLCSVPAAYLGGRIELPREQFLGVLGVVLLLAGAAMWWRSAAAADKVPDDPEPKTTTADSAPSPKDTDIKTKAALGSGLLGVLLGFVSGLVGIGGGIFLSPVLFLRSWAAARTIAAVTSLFILVNSLAGLAGQLSVGVTIPWELLWPLLVAVLIGGQLGTRLTLRKLSPASIRRVAAVLILLVGVRLLVQVAGVY